MALLLGSVSCGPKAANDPKAADPAAPPEAKATGPIIEDGRAWSKIAASVRLAKDVGLGNSDALVLSVWESKSPVVGCANRPVGDSLLAVLSLGVSADLQPTVAASSLAWVNYVQGKSLPVTTAIENQSILLRATELSPDGQTIKRLSLAVKGSVSSRDGAMEIDGLIDADVCSGSRVDSGVSELLGHGLIDVTGYEDGESRLRKFSWMIQQNQSQPWLHRFHLNVELSASEKDPTVLTWSYADLEARLGTRELTVGCGGQRVTVGEATKDQWGSRRIVFYQLNADDCTVTRDLSLVFDLTSRSAGAESRGTVSIQRDNPYIHYGSGDLGPPPAAATN